MFYLTQFFKSIFTDKAKGMLNLLLLTAFVFTVPFKQVVEERVESIIETSNTTAYFHALVSGKENHSWISRKLKQLPGVGYVEILKKNAIQEQAKKIINAESIGLEEDLLDIDFIGMKIGFLNGMNSRSMEMIQDYLKRLVGEEKVSIGAIKNFEKEKEKQSNLNIMASYSFEILMSVIGLFWLISLMSLRKDYFKSAYLVERFQRKKNIVLKSQLFGTILFSFLGLVLFFLQGNSLSLYVGLYFIPVLFVLMIFSRQFEWQN